MNDNFKRMLKIAAELDAAARSEHRPKGFGGLREELEDDFTRIASYIDFLTSKKEMAARRSAEREKAFKNLKNSAESVGYYFENDVITKEEAMPYVLKVLEEDSTWVNRYLNIENSSDIKLMEPEEARPYAFKNLKDTPNFALEYYDRGVITAQEARPYALRYLNKIKIKPANYRHVEYHIDDCVERDILTQEEAEKIIKTSYRRRICNPS